MEEHTGEIIKGRYRVLLSIVLFFQMANCNVVGQLFSYFFLNPTVECDDKYKDESTKECNLSKMCQDNVFINIIDSETLKNWSTIFNLYCPETSYKVIIQTIYFIASGIFPMCLSSLPDKFGRMRMLNIMMILMLCAFILVLYNNKVVHCISMFFCGGLIMIYNVESQIITEYYSPKVRGIITGLFCAAIPVFGIGFILMFYYLKDLRYFWYSLIGIQVASIMIVSIFFVESPIWLLSLNRNKDALLQLYKVAKINGKIEQYKKVEQIINELPPKKLNEKVKTYNMLDVFKFKSTRKIVSLVGVFWPAVMFFDFTVFLNLEKSGSDVYLHGIVVFIACAVAALIAGALADYFGRKKVMIASIFMSCIPYVNVITPYCSQNENLLIVETILLFISCISIETAFTVVVIYASEVFPTSIRSTASGCLYLFSRIGGIAAPYGLAYLTYPQYIVSAILFLTLFLVLPLKETKGQKLKEDIEENSLVKQEILLHSTEEEEAETTGEVELQV